VPKTGLKTLVLGLDGATWEVIDTLFDDGQLDHLRRLMKRGTWASLRSTIPNMSAPAWGAFMTGKNPGKLGVYDFYTYDPTKYSFLEPSLITSAPMSGQSLWDILGRLDYRVGVITVPVTYPPWKVNGFMISGYPCPDTRRNHTYPPELADEIAECCNWRADTQRTATLEELARMGEQMMVQRTDLALRLHQQHPCDFLCLVLGATDMAHHYFWSYSAPGHDRRAADDNLLGDVIPRIYRQADQCLGRLLEICGPDTRVIVLSDHGGGPAADRAVNTNVWLRQMGLLEVARERQLVASMSRRVLQLLKRRIRRWIRIRRWLPDALRHRVRQVSFNVASIDWSRTQAYRFPMSPPAEGLVINVAGRQPQGIVQPGREYEQIRSRLMEQLGQLRDEVSGEKLVSAVYRREDLYSGEYAHQAPDLVVLLKEGYRGGTGLQGPLVTPYPLGQVNGQHTLDGILVAAGPDFRKDHHLEGAHILDVAPTILHALGVPIPEDMDGRVLADLFGENYLQNHPVRYSRPLGPSGAPEGELTAEEEETMKEKLRSLGYLS